MKKFVAPQLDLAVFEAHATEVLALLGALANRRRLMAMCKLAEHGEVSVGALAEMIGLSQPALSQHLAVLRAEGLVDSRRDGTTLFYRVADPRCEALLATLYRLYCKD